MNRKELVEQIRSKKSFLCIGLDPVLERIPEELLKLEDPIFEFNKIIIDATHDLCVSYKPNLAFYEAHGIKGLESFQKTIEYIPNGILTIADAKRGDIGNTSAQYAKAFFETFHCDAITIAPYMGEDSVTPFLGFQDKWVILLGLTSNKGSHDFQFISNDEGPLHEQVILKAQEWGTPEELMFVIGATHPISFKKIRSIAPDSFFLVPGVGAQGGDLESICEYGLNQDVGLLVNSSRGIIYAGEGTKDYKNQIRRAAMHLQSQMSAILDSNNLLA